LKAKPHRKWGFLFPSMGLKPLSLDRKPKALGFK